MKIVGNLICQNGISEIRRCIESVAPVVDEYFVCDGGSDDGTWELLNEWKDVYNLKLYQRKYDDQGKQRNFLLSKAPKDSWVVSLDQDEQLNHQMQRELRDFIGRITPKAYDDPQRKLPLTISVNNINLVSSLMHFDMDNVKVFATKVFYNDKNLHFIEGYHTTICYDDSFPPEYTNAVPAPQSWVIKHYAYLNPERLNSHKDNKRVYNKGEFDPKSWKIHTLPEIWR